VQEVEFFYQHLLTCNTRALGRTHENDERRSRRNEKLAIMVDADEGYLANFTKPVQDRLALFFEIIQRMEPKVLDRELQGTFESIERRRCEERYKTWFFFLCEKNNHSNGLNFINDVLNFFFSFIS
jgi:hypothetical protein